ncbi:hypothetical protein [Nocardia asteroides]|uniref:hypothetical protein n=1 Tax=Nocardia asteroides TaxID=1824 RepID=UPI0033C3DC84
MTDVDASELARPDHAARAAASRRRIRHAAGGSQELAEPVSGPLPALLVGGRVGRAKSTGADRDST